MQNAVFHLLHGFNHNVNSSPVTTVGLLILDRIQDISSGTLLRENLSFVPPQWQLRSAESSGAITVSGFELPNVGHSQWRPLHSEIHFHGWSCAACWNSGYGVWLIRLFMLFPERGMISGFLHSRTPRLIYWYWVWLLYFIHRFTD